MWRKLIYDIKRNLVKRQLMPLKFLFFTMYAGNTTLYPYLAVHLQSLGFGADEAAIMLGIIPLVSMMGPPLAGAIADRIGNFKALFSGIVALSGALSLLLLTVPTVPPPSGLSLTLLTDQLPHELPAGLDMLAETLPKAEVGRAVDAEFLQWVVVNIQFGCDVGQEYATTIDGIQQVNVGQAEPKSRVNLTQIEKVDRMAIMAMTSHHPISCRESDPQVTVEDDAIQMLLYVLKDYNTTQYMGNMLVDNPWTLNNSHVSFTTVKDILNAFQNQSLKPWWNSGCKIFIPGLCTSKREELQESVNAEAMSFWTYLFARTLLNSAVNAAFMLFEGATVTLLKMHDGDYGLQRVWGYIGSMVSTPFSGWMIDKASKEQTTTDYRPAFYLFVLMQVIAGVIALTVDLKFKRPSKRVLQNIFKFLKNPQIIMLYVAMVISGAFYGFLEAFLFWFLGDLGASRYLMGLTVTVGAATALPFLIVASPIVFKMGHIGCLAFGFLMYAVRFAGYASIRLPIDALYFEALEGVTNGLMLSAAVMYAAELSTTENVVSLQAIAGTLHYSVGKGIGSLVGGYMYYHYGARKTFRLMTVSSLASAMIMFVFHLMYIKRQRQRINSKIADDGISLMEDSLNILKMKEFKEKTKKWMEDSYSDKESSVKDQEGSYYESGKEERNDKSEKRKKIKKRKSKTNKPYSKKQKKEDNYASEDELDEEYDEFIPKSSNKVIIIKEKKFYVVNEGTQTC